MASTATISSAIEATYSIVYANNGVERVCKSGLTKAELDREWSERIEGRSDSYAFAVRVEEEQG